MKADLILYNIGKLYTMSGGVKTKETMRELEVLEHAYIIITNQTIQEIGTGMYDEMYVGESTHIINCHQKLVTPSFIDSHTHLVHGGSRENEFTMKLEGVPYLDILSSGGGILSTVRSTREATFDDLYEKAYLTLNNMLKLGVTTVEAKSGYGLNIETEIKQLEVVEKLNKKHIIDLVPTFMGAHAIPLEYKSNKQAFIDSIIQMLPIIKERSLATFCDLFCEKGIFEVEESRTILLKAKELGFDLKIHADEIVSIGGAELAAELGVTSAEHLMAASTNGIHQLAKQGVVCTLLPGTSFNLNKAYAPAREMIDAGCIINLATDYNPGSCPCENLQLVMQIASTQMRLTPEEVLCAVTINAAKALNLEEQIGSIEIGKKANINIYNASNLDYVLYHFGINHVEHVIKDGKMVVFNQTIVKEK